MITSLAAMGRLRLGTGLTPRVAADRLDLPDALAEMGVMNGSCRSARWQHTGSYLRILGSYARDATPVPTAAEGAKETQMAGPPPPLCKTADKGRALSYFHSTFITS